MHYARNRHTASILRNGKVLVAGGGGYHSIQSSAELYDPSTETWTAIGNMRDTRLSHTESVLTNGEVLVTGGRNDQGWILDSADLYESFHNK
jgi:N-acetylneuraminic acid mutarotase